MFEKANFLYLATTSSRFAPELASLSIFCFVSCKTRSSAVQMALVHFVDGRGAGIIMSLVAAALLADWPAPHSARHPQPDINTAIKLVAIFFMCARIKFLTLHGHTLCDRAVLVAMSKRLVVRHDDEVVGTRAISGTERNRAGGLAQKLCDIGYKANALCIHECRTRRLHTTYLQISLL